MPPESRWSVRDEHPVVLVVDDDALVREAISGVLSPRGLRVEPCGDALQALARLRAGLAPDVILLDLRLPGMDGWEFRLIQKGHAVWSQIPLIALSADASAKAAAIDADAFLAKPLLHKPLRETVERFVAAKRSLLLAERELEMSRARDIADVAASMAQQLNPDLSALLRSLELAQRGLEALETSPKVARGRGVDVQALLAAAKRSGTRMQAALHDAVLLAEVLLHTAPGKRRVLLAHSDKRLALLLRAALSDDHDVLLVADGSEAVRALQDENYDIFLCELALPEIDGITLYESLRTTRPEQAARTAFLTAPGAFAERERTFFAQYRPWQLRAPFCASDLRELVEAARLGFH